MLAIYWKCWIRIILWSFGDIIALWNSVSNSKCCRGAYHHTANRTMAKPAYDGLCFTLLTKHILPLISKCISFYYIQNYTAHMKRILFVIGHKGNLHQKLKHWFLLFQREFSLQWICYISFDSGGIAMCITTSSLISIPVLFICNTSISTNLFIKTFYSKVWSCHSRQFSPVLLHPKTSLCCCLPYVSCYVARKWQFPILLCKIFVDSDTWRIYTAWMSLENPYL